MKGKRNVIVLPVTAVALLGVVILLTGCDNTKEQEKTLPAYIIIHEELDAEKTADKVSEIMNYTPDTDVVSGNP